MSLLKDLGSLKGKILAYLAENSESHIQKIQKGIGHPDDQYSSVHKAVKSLEKNGYIIAEEGTSDKSVKIKLYSCTDTGVFYVLSKHLDPNIIQIFKNYRKRYPVFDFMLKEHDRMKPELFDKMFSITMQSLPLAEKSNIDAAGQMLSLMVKMIEDFTEEERIEFLKDTLEYFPQARTTFSKLQNLVEAVTKTKEEDKE